MNAANSYKHHEVSCNVEWRSLDFAFSYGVIIGSYGVMMIIELIVPLIWIISRSWNGHTRDKSDLTQFTIN